MAEYTVTDSQTGKEITFEWHDKNEPTQQDMLAVFAEANKQSKPVANPVTDQKIMGAEPPTPEWAGKSPNLYGAYGALRELYRTVGKPAIETVGMIGGGALGLPLGIAGGAAGAGLGYAGARNLTGALDQAFDLERGQNVTMPKVLKSTAKDILLGSVGGGSPTKSILQKEILANKHIGTPVTKEMLSGTGINLSPAEVTGGSTLAQVESLLGQTPFASDVIQNWREANQLKPLIALRNKYLETGLENTPRGEVLGQQIKAAIDKRIGQFDVAKTETVNSLRDSVLGKLGSKESYETLSKEAQNIINTKSADAVAKKNLLYRAVDDVMPEGELPFTTYQAEAQRHLDELSKLSNPDKELIKILKWGTKVEQSPEELAILEEIAQYPPNIQKSMMDKMGIEKVTEVTKDWKTMQAHRNELNDFIKSHDLSVKANTPGFKGQVDDAGRRAKLLRKALDDDFEQIAQDKGGDVLDRFNVAQAFYSEEYTPVWKNKVIQNMAHKNPSELVDIAIKPGSTTEVLVTKQALGEEGFNRTIKPAFTNKLLGAGRDEAFSPQVLQKRLNNYGDETLLNIYTPSELNILKGIAKNGQIILDKELPNASLMKSLVKSDNGQVVINSVMSSIEKNPNSNTVLKNVSAINNILSQPQKEGLKKELLERLFRINQTTEQVEAGTMAKNIYNLNPVIKKLFTPEEVKGLDNLAILGKTMIRAQQLAANPSGTAKNVIAFGVSNELIFKPMELLLQGHPLQAAGKMGVAAVSKVLGAKTLAKIYMSPKGHQLLTKALTTPRFTKEGMDIAKQISIILGNDYMDTQ
jgi:hypothetical protein